MSDQLIADLALAAMLAMFCSLTAGFLINAIRTRRPGRDVLVLGLAFCAALDVLLTYVNTLPRP